MIPRITSANGQVPVARIFQNSLLKNLSPEIIARLDLSKVNFDLGYEIEFPGQTIGRLFFVEEGMASITTTFIDGSQVEVGMFGYESVIGASALMGTKRSLNRIYTQIPGHGYSCRLDNAKREFQLCGAFHDIALRYVQAQLVQVMQSAGCNATHELQQRLARWLLTCADRAHSLTFKLPHQFIAMMLGNSRPSVTVAAGLLREKGLIEYRNQAIEIIDPKGLEQIACECYHVIKDHLDNYTEFDTGTVR